MKETIYEKVGILNNYKRGDIYLAKLDGLGSEQRGTRPVLILQNNNRNETSNTLICVCLTSKNKRLDMKCHIKLNDESIVLCEQIKTIDKRRVIKKIGHVEGDQLKQIEDAVRNTLRL